jgi:hypothetical protein
VRIAGVSTEIRIEHLPNTASDSYRYVNLLAGALIDLSLFFLHESTLQLTIQIRSNLLVWKYIFMCEMDNPVEGMDMTKM